MKLKLIAEFYRKGNVILFVVCFTLERKMSIVRIYQGRVSRMREVVSEKKSGVELGEVMGKDSLFKFHELWSDAVNYYLLTIGAMVRGSQEARLKNFVLRLSECWKPYPKKGAHYEGLRSMMGRYFAVTNETSFEEACDLILANEGEEISQEVYQLAGESLLQDLGGEGKIQQGSKTYLPLFCDAWTKANFPRGPVNRLKGEGKVLLPSLLWLWSDRDSVEDLLESLPFEYFANPNTAGTMFVGEEARARLSEAVENEHKMEKFSDEQLEDLRAKVAGLPDEVSFPKYTGGSVNKEALLRRLNVYLLLRYVSPESDLVLRLRSLVKEPAKKVTEYVLDEQEERLYGLGEDPIRLARGERGYVFPAFSSLSKWKDGEAGGFRFKGFDIQAFAEALKGISQFQTMTQKREKELAMEKGRRDWIRGISDQKPVAEEGEEEVLSRLGGDARFERLEKIMGGLEDEQGEKMTARTLRVRGFRHYREIREGWLKLLKAERQVVDQEKLHEVIAKCQGRNARTMGDVGLFELLTLPENQVVWHPPIEEEKGHPHDVVKAALDLGEIERKIKSLERPVKLSPAHPTLSRRQFLFSDLTGSSKAIVSFANPAEQYALVSISINENGTWREKRVRLDFSAPRVVRDGLGKPGEDWLPPMMKALGVEVSKPDFSKVAVALMPEVKSDDETAYLLNFPVTLEFSGGEKAGLARVDWAGQLNGTNDKKLHLHDPAHLKKQKKYPAWFTQKEAVKEGVQILGVDLGLRAAAAWALVEMSREKDAKKPVVDLAIGEDFGGPWWGRVKGTGTVRLPGEDQKVWRDGKWQQEFYGSRGRPADEEEYAKAKEIEALIDDDPGSWVGRRARSFSFPEQNDQLVKVLRRLMSRRRSLYRFSWQDDERKARKGLAAFSFEKSLSEMAADESIPWVTVREAMKARYQELRGQITSCLEGIADRVLPIRQHRWRWEAHSSEMFREKGWCELVSHQAPDFRPKVKGQRGLSLRRIEQITAFRKCLLSFNRSCQEVFGEKPIKGEDMEDESVPEPCPSILKRLKELKDQRIKKTAHGIIEKALGLRLVHQEDKPALGDVHGVYEKIPGRRPVDLIVLEDMGRYLASQGRGKHENSSLMQWCHRAILDKVKEMAEPFGMTVLEVAPDYSSRFHSLTGKVGFRANRVSSREAASDYARWICDEKERSKRTEREDFLRQLFLRHREAQEKGIRLGALFVPQDGGTDFIGVVRVGEKLEAMTPYQADLNAAVSLALAGVAAPRAFQVHRKVRLERKGDELLLVRTNKREKAAYASKARIDSGEASPKVYQNAFLDHGGVAIDGRLRSKQIEGDLATSLALFAEVKKWRYELCRRLNNGILAGCGLKEIAQVSGPVELPAAMIDDEDDIP